MRNKYVIPIIIIICIICTSGCLDKVTSISQPQPTIAIYATPLPPETQVIITPITPIYPEPTPPNIPLPTLQI
jgi:hypothetical protein